MRPYGIQHRDWLLAYCGESLYKKAPGKSRNNDERRAWRSRKRTARRKAKEETKELTDQ